MVFIYHVFNEIFNCFKWIGAEGSNSIFHHCQNVYTNMEVVTYDIVEILLTKKKQTKEKKNN